jgi:flagellar motor switch/type III secretory pathway protein FliN
MNVQWKDFVEKSELAARIRPEAKVVIHRTTVTPAQLLGMKKKGSLEPLRKKTDVCELEVSGQVLAEGRIVRGADGHYLKITKVL